MMMFIGTETLVTQLVREISRMQACIWSSVSYVHVRARAHTHTHTHAHTHHNPTTDTTTLLISGGSNRSDPPTSPENAITSPLRPRAARPPSIERSEAISAGAIRLEQASDSQQTFLEFARQTDEACKRFLRAHVHRATGAAAPTHLTKQAMEEEAEASCAKNRAARRAEQRSAEQERSRAFVLECSAAPENVGRWPWHERDEAQLKEDERQVKLLLERQRRAIQAGKRVQWDEEESSMQSILLDDPRNVSLMVSKAGVLGTRAQQAREAEEDCADAVIGSGGCGGWRGQVTVATMHPRDVKILRLCLLRWERASVAEKRG
jgi:hypothetical protein